MGPTRVSEAVRGAWSGLIAATLFGASAPFAKLILAQAGPLMLGGLLYTGAGLGLTAISLAPRRGHAEAVVRSGDWGILTLIVLLGGVSGPLLMLSGLARLPGAVASLLLNLEAPFTIVLAIGVWKEHLGRREAAAAALIVAGASFLALPSGGGRVDGVGALLIAGACLCWGLDNNLTQRLTLRDPLRIVQVKALGAGALMLILAFARGETLPPGTVTVLALVLGFVSYGLSVWLDAYALRFIGAAREAAYFATAPFIGALASLPLLGERLHPIDYMAAFLMMVGVVSLLRARHSHLHAHEPLEHDHVHVHDEHHQHEHPAGMPVGPEPHAHPHHHVQLVHDHPHVSDAHHRHAHS